MLGACIVLAPTRDATAAAALHFDRSTSTWDALGQRVTGVDQLTVSPFGDTAVVQTVGSNKTFCPPQMFDPDPAALVGTTQQLLRPLDGFARVLEPDTYAAPNRSGTCAGLLSPTGVTLVDLTQRIELDLLAGDTAITWAG